MAKTITAFFRTREEGEGAVQTLLSQGFTRDEVSFLVGDTRGHSTPALGPVQEVGEATEAGRDAWVGGLVGLAAGMVAVVLPGIGPLIAAGPIAGAIGGLSVGVAAGGVIGLLKDYGVSQEQAEFYAEGVRRGGALITMQAASDDLGARAQRILKSAGAIEVEKLADEFRDGSFRQAS